MSSLFLWSSVVLGCSTRSGLKNYQSSLVTWMRFNGAAYVEDLGCSNIALSRNRVLTGALRECERRPDREVLLLFDDDMSFSLADVEMLCRKALSLERPVSGVYRKKRADELCARPEISYGSNRWITGLGFMAVPLKALSEIAQQSYMTTHEPPLFCIVQSGHMGEIKSLDRVEWLNEDAWFCHRFEGVSLCTDVVLGHETTGFMLPTSDDVNRLEQLM